MSTVYQINKGINRSIVFKGIKAQYIIYLAGGLVALLILFAALYVIGLGIYACLIVVIPSGVGLITGVQTFSKKFGEHGLIKHASKKKLPTCIHTNTRNCFIRLSEGENEEYEKSGRRSSHLQS